MFCGCIAEHSVTDLTRNSETIIENLNSFYCTDSKTHDGRSSTTITFDDSCAQCCAAITKLPKGVEIFKSPYEFKHSGQMYAFMSKPYVFKCKPGFAYRSGTVWSQKGRQALQCNGVTHTYYDLDTWSTEAQIEPCEELKGCHQISQRSDMTVVVEGCVQSGNIFAAGCI
ncbi:unnamed protein product, partial [Anisakis simplex]|uniref:Sushi domain-containing protein n=1 Tax=Anisakis simplex TaxID=6269 RepID=A0A0M3J9D0_ANISI